MTLPRAQGKLSLGERVIPLLADGEFHSGEQLAKTLNVSRAAIWKALNALEALGLELHRVPKRGYRLSYGSRYGLELLRADAIEARLSTAGRSRLRELEVLPRTDSTNSRLLDGARDLPAGKADVCLAEFQSAGRGRRGRAWIAPFGGSLCLSMSWLFPEAPAQLGTLSLTSGVAVLRALRTFEVRGLSLKWPNDIFLNRRKLGGILIELRAESAGPAFVVIGIGLNLHLTAAARQSIRQEANVKAGNTAGIEPAALTEGAPGGQVSRNAVAAAVIDQLILALSEFQQNGFHGFAREWREADVLASAPAQVSIDDEVHRGIARGIDENGALLLETPRRLLRFTSGEVSLRPADQAADRTTDQARRLAE